MRINFILPFTNITGGVKIVFEYANRLQAKGGYMKRIKVSLGNTFKRKNKCNWFDVNVPIKLIPYINQKFIRDADIIIATAWPTSYDVYKMSLSKGKKIYFIQGYEVWSGDKDKVDGSYRLPLKQITISKELQTLMVEKFGKNDVDVVYNGIDTDVFYNDNKVINNKNVLMLYSDLEQKGFSDGIRTFEIIKHKYPDLKLSVFGAKHGIDIPKYAEFHLKPEKNELRELYSNADIFIFPSREEGWGLTPIEAMACKCAVVGTNVGSIKEIGINGENCLVSNPMDIDGMVNNILSILDDKELMKKISINGNNSALNLSWNSSVDKFEKILIDSLK